MDYTDKQLATQAVHAGSHGDHETGALVSPLFMTSTYEWTPEKMERYQRGDKEGIFTYGRSRNPTQNDLQEKLSTMYGAENALVTASGMAAISLAILEIAKPGDHIISGRTIYGGTHALFSKIFEELKIDVTFVHDMDEKTLEGALKPNTKAIYSESVFNPTLELLDTPALAKWAKSKGIRSIVDNTFLSPALYSPLKDGIDVVVDSTTKYINGHGDLIGGSICGKFDYIDGIRASIYQELGPVPSPFSCWLMLRGLKTLHLRMRAHCENALEIAKWLEDHDCVESVRYPGLHSHPQHALAKSLYGDTGYGGMIAFVVKGGLKGASDVIARMEMIKYAVSLGDLDTMAQQPATMTHGKMSREERERMGIADGMIRLSVGVEDVRDIKADLDKALRG